MYSNVDEYISELITRDEILGFLAEIEKMRESVYKTGDEGLERVLQNQVGEKSSRVIAAELQKSGKMGDPRFQEGFFENIQTKLRSIPLADLELAAEPSREFVTGIRDKISEYAGVPVAINYKLSSGLMAGIRISFNGKYCDFSLESMWSEIWEVIRGRLKFTT